MAAKFAPGEKLTVRGIASMLGISAMPVRAAFTRLIAEQAVIQNVNGTVQIPHMTREHYEELIMLRAMLEGKAAEIAASKIDRKLLAELEKIGKALTLASKEGDAESYIALNQRFKFAVVAAAKSPVLADTVERLWLQVGPFMRFYADDIHTQHELDKHEAAIEALRAGDGASARRAIEHDILDGAESLFSKISLK